MVIIKTHIFLFGLLEPVYIFNPQNAKKPASENVVCLCRLLNILANFSSLFLRTAKSVEPDQTAPEQSDLGLHSLQKWHLKSQADDKADNSCCDWQFKG